MSLKNNRFFKYFTILLFSVELLAPVFLYSPAEKMGAETAQRCLHDSTHQFNLLTFLLCEEAGNEEEREGKDHKTCIFSLEIVPVAFFTPPEQFQEQAVYSDLDDRVASQPSLIILFGNYRI